MSIVILTVLFGFPFAFLQRKCDLTSAMIAHGTVMAFANPDTNSIECAKKLVEIRIMENKNSA